jgi:tetratricopeptide (TPR) repeat protein
LGDKISEADMLQLLGWIEQDEENYDSALKYYAQAEEIRLSFGLKTSAMHVLKDIASLERIFGRYEAARINIEKCIIYFRDTNDKVALTSSLRELGEILINLGEIGQSVISLREGLQISQYTEDPRFKGDCLFSLTKAFKLQGNFYDAARLLGAIEVESNKDLWQFSAPRMANYNQNFKEIKSSMGESAFASAYAEGRAMTLDQGVTYALEIIK